MSTNISYDMFVPIYVVVHLEDEENDLEHGQRHEQQQMPLLRPRDKHLVVV